MLWYTVYHNITNILYSIPYTIIKYGLLMVIGAKKYELCFDKLTLGFYAANKNKLIKPNNPQISIKKIYIYILNLSIIIVHLILLFNKSIIDLIN